MPLSCRLAPAVTNDLAELAGFHWSCTQMPCRTCPPRATTQEFFCSPKFTSAIGDFLSTNTSELEFKPIEEEQPLKVWG